MGHSHISTTMRYVHPTPEHKQDAIRKLQEFNAERASGQSTLEGSPQESPQLGGNGGCFRRCEWLASDELAERGGFEPPIQVLARITV